MLRQMVYYQSHLYKERRFRLEPATIEAVEEWAKFLRDHSLSRKVQSDCRAIIKMIADVHAGRKPKP